MLENLVEVGAPAAEVIVDVHGGHAGFARAAFQAGDRACGGNGARQHAFCALEVEGVDHVDDQQRDRRFVRRVAV